MQKLFENFRKFKNLTEADNPAPRDWDKPWRKVDKELEKLKQQMRDQIGSGKFDTRLEEFEGPFGEKLDFKDHPKKLGLDEWIKEGSYEVSVKVKAIEGKSAGTRGGFKFDFKRLDINITPKRPGQYIGQWDKNGKLFRVANLVMAVNELGAGVENADPHAVMAINRGPDVGPSWSIGKQLKAQAYVRQEIDRQVNQMISKLQSRYETGAENLQQWYNAQDSMAQAGVQKEIAELKQFRKNVLNQLPDPDKLFEIDSKYFTFAMARHSDDMRRLIIGSDAQRTAFDPDPKQGWFQDDVDGGRFMKRLEGAHLSDVVRKIETNPSKAMDLELLDPMIRQANKVGWDNLSPRQKGLVTNRLISLQLARDLNLTGKENPVVRKIDALDNFVDAYRDLGKGLKHVDTSSRQIALVGTKKPGAAWFKNFLKKIPFFGAGFAVVLFPYDEAQAAWNRGLEREAGTRKPWRGENLDISVAGGIQQLGTLFGDDPQAEFKSILILEMFRAADPGIELVEMLATLSIWAAEEAGPEMLKWLLSAPKRSSSPSPEDIEDYPELDRQYTPKDYEPEEIGPVPSG